MQLRETPNFLKRSPVSISNEMISISFIVKRLIVPILFSVFAPPVLSQTQPCAKLS